MVLRPRNYKLIFINCAGISWVCVDPLREEDTQVFFPLSKIWNIVCKMLFWGFLSPAEHYILFPTRQQTHFCKSCCTSFWLCASCHTFCEGFGCKFIRTGVTYYCLRGLFAAWSLSCSGVNASHCVYRTDRGVAPMWQCHIGPLWQPPLQSTLHPHSFSVWVRTQLTLFTELTQCWKQVPNNCAASSTLHLLSEATGHVWNKSSANLKLSSVFVSSKDSLPNCSPLSVSYSRM